MLKSSIWLGGVSDLEQISYDLKPAINYLRPEAGRAFDAYYMFCPGSWQNTISAFFGFLGYAIGQIPSLDLKIEYH
jgi:hypothetical protein